MAFRNPTVVSPSGDNALCLNEGPRAITNLPLRFSGGRRAAEAFHTGSLCSLIAVLDRYVEVKYVLPNTQLRVKRERWCVPHIRLHENYISCARRRQLLESSYQCRRDAYTPVLWRYGNIVNVNFAALLLEFRNS